MKFDKYSTDQTLLYSRIGNLHKKCLETIDHKKKSQAEYTSTFLEVI